MIPHCVTNIDYTIKNLPKLRTNLNITDTYAYTVPFNDYFLEISVHFSQKDAFPAPNQQYQSTAGSL